jgi:hypothetical protein
MSEKESSKNLSAVSLNRVPKVTNSFTQKEFLVALGVNSRTASKLIGLNPEAEGDRCIINIKKPTNQEEAKTLLEALGVNSKAAEKLAKLDTMALTCIVQINTKLSNGKIMFEDVRKLIASGVLKEDDLTISALKKIRKKNP